MSARAREAQNGLVMVWRRVTTGVSCSGGGGSSTFTSSDEEAVASRRRRRTPGRTRPAPRRSPSSSAPPGRRRSPCRARSACSSGTSRPARGAAAPAAPGAAAGRRSRCGGAPYPAQALQIGPAVPHHDAVDAGDRVQRRRRGLRRGGASAAGREVDEGRRHRDDGGLPRRRQECTSREVFGGCSAMRHLGLLRADDTRGAGPRRCPSPFRLPVRQPVLADAVGLEVALLPGHRVHHLRVVGRLARSPSAIRLQLRIVARVAEDAPGRLLEAGPGLAELAPRGSARAPRRGRARRRAGPPRGRR